MTIPISVNDGQYSNFTGQPLPDSVAVTDYTNVDGKITHNVSTVFDGNGNYNTAYVITFDAPTSACVGGRTYTNSASVEIKKPEAPTDCNSCLLPTTLEASAPIVFISDLADAVDQHEREATYNNLNANGLDNSAYQAAAEICSTVVFDQVVSFTTAAPASWEIDLGPGPAPNLHSVRFRDILEQSMRAPGGIKENLDIEVYCFRRLKPSAPLNGLVPGGNYVTERCHHDGSKVEIDLKALRLLLGSGQASGRRHLMVRYAAQAASINAP